MAEKTPREWRPWLIVAGLGLVITVNMGMLYLANRNFPGLVGDQFCCGTPLQRVA